MNIFFTKKLTYSLCHPTSMWVQYQIKKLQMLEKQINFLLSEADDVLNDLKRCLYIYIFFFELKVKV